MEGTEIYYFIRLIFFIFILCSVIISVMMIGPPGCKKLINGFTVGLFSFVAILVSVINGTIGGYLADGIYPGGDSFIFYLFIILFILCVLNIILYVNIERQRNSV
ncbi:hypothetical protein [Metabacillus fastidiosus]|uniref:hypothetical protein n=1 Tax=Metabacillus fastidiosus TaxID=1458 RepID=UPI002E24D228|nr:hypothetical protein [Metabacillus fastidiosus]